MKIYCPQCEAENPEDAPMCGLCGHLLNATDPMAGLSEAAKKAAPLKVNVTTVPGSRKLLNKKTVVNVVALLLIAPFVLVPLTCVYTCYQAFNAPPRPPGSKRPPGFDASAEMQEERKRIIQEMFHRGFWEKTEFTGSRPKLWITPAFAAMDEKFQNNMLGAVHAYWMASLDDFGCDGIVCDSMILKLDTGTPLGRRIGTYDPWRGVKYK